MTPSRVTTIDLRELKEIELRCECGTLIRLPLSIAAKLPQEQGCPSCGRMMWAYHSPVLDKIRRVLGAIADWKDAGYKDLALRFVLTEESVSGN
ncbi:MAG TPA: hypothetical protein VEI73_16470 [Candidatus Acidoferrum sp.]|nr:hypothetical protein [Candidatus Acidoferrum sp.]